MERNFALVADVLQFFPELSIRRSLVRAQFGEPQQAVELKGLLRKAFFFGATASGRPRDRHGNVLRSAWVPGLPLVRMNGIAPCAIMWGMRTVPVPGQLYPCGPSAARYRHCGSGLLYPAKSGTLATLPRKSYTPPPAADLRSPSHSALPRMVAAVERHAAPSGCKGGDAPKRKAPARFPCRG